MPTTQHLNVCVMMSDDDDDDDNGSRMPEATRNSHTAEAASVKLLSRC
jgi:hypothetical protein